MASDLVAPLKFTAKLACVEVLLDLGGGQDHAESQGHKETAKKFLKQLETGCYTAVSEKLLKRLVFMYPEKLTNQLLVALVPSHLRELTLKGCVGLSADGLKKVVSRCPHLSRIDLTRCQQFSSPALFAMITYYRPNITAISLEHCENLSDKSVKILLKNLKSLKHINLSSCTALTDKVFLVNEDLQLNKECDLNLEYNKEGYECSLVSVDISCTTLSSVAVRHLTTLSGPTIQSINLSWTGMDALALLYLSGYGIAAVADLALASSGSLDSELVESLQELQRTLLQLKLKNQSKSSSHQSDDEANKQDDEADELDDENFDETDEDISNIEKPVQLSITTCKTQISDSAVKHLPDNCQSETSQNTSKSPYVFHPDKELSNQSELISISFPDKNQSSSDPNLLHSDNSASVSPVQFGCNHISDSYQTNGMHSHAESFQQNLKFDCNTLENNTTSTVFKLQDDTGLNFAVCQDSLASSGSEGVCAREQTQTSRFEADTETNFTPTPDSGVCLIHDGIQCVQDNSSVSANQQYNEDTELNDLSVCHTTNENQVSDKILGQNDLSVCDRSDGLTNENQVSDKNLGQNDLSVCDRSDGLTNDNQVSNKSEGQNDLSVCDRSIVLLTNEKRDSLSPESVDMPLVQPLLLDDNRGCEATSEKAVFLETHSMPNDKGTFKSDYGIILSNNSEEIMKSCDFKETNDKSPHTDSCTGQLGGKFYKPNIVSLSIENLSCQNSYGIDIFKCLTLFSEENPGLKKLVVSGTEILDNKSLQKLSKQWPSLRELRLNECENLTHQGISSLGLHCKKLSTVYLQGVNFIHDLTVFSILKNKNIEVLNLAECAITDSTLKRIADFNMDKLRALNLSWCDDLTEDGLNCVCSRQSDTLYKLSFRQLPVSNTTLDLISANLQQLKIVNLSSVGTVDDPALINLVKHLPLLENIDISWNSAITDDTIFALMINCPRLQVAVLAGLKRLTSAPFLPLISDIKQWRRCQALLQFKLRERKVKEEVDLGSSSDEEYGDLYLPHRSTVYSPDLRTLNLEYCDRVADRDLNEISFICRQSITITNYYGEIVKPELSYNACWYSNYLDL